MSARASLQLSCKLTRSALDSFDRFRTALKGTWKDLPLPANGQTYDLGTHLIDQVLVLFGRPQRINAQIENVRGLGSPEVDDTVCLHFNFSGLRTENLP